MDEMDRLDDHAEAWGSRERKFNHGIGDIYFS